jgi:radical SAM superfamily enzyme YgiQ (UPF0313 family)
MLEGNFMTCDDLLAQNPSFTSKEDLYQFAENQLDNLFNGRPVEKVLFVMPPDSEAGSFHYPTGKRGRYTNFPPYGPGLLATHLRKIGVKVEIINLNNLVLRACRLSESAETFDFDATWKKDLADKLNEFKPDIVGVTSVFSMTHPSLVKVCKEIQLLHPTLPLAAGGFHITNSLTSPENKDSFLSDMDAVDLFFLYECDVAFSTFINVVNKKEPLNLLTQVQIRSEDRVLHFSDKNVPKGDELDAVPAHDLMETSELTRWGTLGGFYSFKKPGTRITSVQSVRGCRAECTFCNVRNFNGLGVRRRSTQSVIDELIMLRQEYDVEHIVWLDDDILYDRRKALELFNEMVRQDVGITWDASNGVIAASCTEEMMAAAAASGCLGLILGIESGNREILRQIKKPGTVETFQAAAEVLRKFEQIHARGFLMIGFPGETYRQILDTIDLCSKMRLDWHNIAPLQPLPNTPIFKSMLIEGKIKKEDAEFSKLGWYSGPQSKARKKAEKSHSDLLEKDFKNAFNVPDLDVEPPKESFDDIWAYMQYHLNFYPLFLEERPVKLKQQLSYLENITGLIAPENAFAMYFAGYLQHKLYGKISENLIQTLEERLKLSPYWLDRFQDFNLSAEHLKAGVFEFDLNLNEG